MRVSATSLMCAMMLHCYNTGGPPTLSSVEPNVGDVGGGSHITLSGSNFTGTTGVTIGGTACTSVVVVNGSTVTCVTPAKAAGTYDVILTTPEGSDTLAGGFESWSPTQISGARLFDSNVGVTSTGSATNFGFTRLTATLDAGWVARDGPHLHYLPATGKFWMVAGWNPTADIFVGNECTDEVWSTVDGISWTKDLADGNGAFSPRHFGASLVTNSKIVIIGGDHYEGSAYHRDIISSSNGTTWTQEMVTTPWAARMLHVAGQLGSYVYVFGGQNGLLGEASGSVVYHNDVWRAPTNDLDNWTQIVADGAASATRPSGRGIIDGMPAWEPTSGAYSGGGERAWLVSGGRYENALDPARTYFQEVWSTVDFVTWVEHTAPPFDARTYHSVRVFDGKLWVLGGYTAASNQKDCWYTEDGENWTQLDNRYIELVESHADGYAVGPDFMLAAGGNRSFTPDMSVWRLDARHGAYVTDVADQGAGGIDLSATGIARPMVIGASDVGGLTYTPAFYFDGGDNYLDSGASRDLVSGHTVMWYGRTPFSLPQDVNIYTPRSCIVGGDLGGGQFNAIGLEDGAIRATDGSTGWTDLERGNGYSANYGSAKAFAVTRATDGTVKAYADGAQVGADGSLDYLTAGGTTGWQAIGIGLGQTGVQAYTNKLQGTYGAFFVCSGVVSAADVARFDKWARGRYGAAL